LVCLDVLSKIGGFKLGGRSGEFEEKYIDQEGVTGILKGCFLGPQQLDCKNRVTKGFRVRCLVRRKQAPSLRSQPIELIGQWSNQKD
jgi:hypothetical protein